MKFYNQLARLYDHFIDWEQRIKNEDPFSSTCSVNVSAPPFSTWAAVPVDTPSIWRKWVTT